MKGELSAGTLDWTRLPSLTALRAFEAAARTRSFSAAARTLNVTHAAIGQQVKALETHLGVALVQRSPRGLTLTPDGEALAARLRDGFTAIAEAVHTIEDRERNRPVRVTTTAYFAESVIFPRISAFWAAHPGVEVAFTPSDRALDLVAEGYDIAIRAGEGGWSGLRETLLLQSRTIACIAPAMVDDPATDWTAVPWLLPEASLWERDALRQSGIDPEAIKVIDLGNPSLEIRAAEEGVGLVLESEIDLAAPLSQGRLKVAPIPITHVSKYFVVTPPWSPRPAAQVFIDWLRDQCSDAAGHPPKSGET